MIWSMFGVAGGLTATIVFYLFARNAHIQRRVTFMVIAIYLSIFGLLAATASWILFVKGLYDLFRR